jgi:hypothetical protein
VNVENNKVDIYKPKTYDDESDTTIYENRPKYKYVCSEVFIGKSPKTTMTSVSKGYGRKYDGNTILLNVGHHKYIFIGDEIYSFTTKSKIIEYVSPIGNNDVPYPFAIDETRNYYLFVEKLYVNEMYIPKDKVKDKNPYYSTFPFEENIKNLKIIDSHHSKEVQMREKKNLIRMASRRKVLKEKSRRKMLREKSRSRKKAKQ